MERKLCRTFYANYGGTVAHRVNRVGPGLHHFPALLDIGCVVVGVVYFVGITMGKLALDPIFVVHAAVQFGAQQVLEAMIGLASFIAHEAKRLLAMFSLVER